MLVVTFLLHGTHRSPLDTRVTGYPVLNARVIDGGA